MRDSGGSGNGSETLPVALTASARFEPGEGARCPIAVARAQASVEHELAQDPRAPSVNLHVHGFLRWWPIDDGLMERTQQRAGRRRVRSLDEIAQGSSGFASIGRVG